ncbi:hypothetical protein SAMN05444682_11683 [Parapedobacter indicus]|uniref:Uncharacterized protein n=1 Tax=Parapedobacter indicus TaxID=1477437 RepID=A0A1I3VEX1_9SPHI|nr:hypothetical protein CLV26_1161 [Parapedobacter indicus]SFJ93690.1 hypothetical protein SAMN05444682_11683 [Parapedobacter indicus]
MRLLFKPHNGLNKIYEHTFETLQEKIVRNFSKYIVMPVYLEDSNIRIPYRIKNSK